MKTTRRHFLQQFSAGLAAAPLISQPALAQGADRKLNVAFVGLGSYASRVADAILETSNCRVAGAVTGTPAKGEAWVKKYGFPQSSVYSYQNFDQIASNKDIDAVYIALPNSMHREYSIRAAKAGKHVICEKPMALTVDDCQAMIDACKQAKVALMIGYRMHFEPHTMEVMRIQREKPFGKVRLVEASFGFPIGDPTQWRLKKAYAGGGPLMDVGIYAVNAARYVTGEEPKSVTAQFGPKTNPTKFAEVEESVFWQFEMPSGIMVNSSSTYNASVERLYASYEKGMIELSPAYSYGPIKGRTHQGPMNYPHRTHQAWQMEGMAKILLNNEPVPGHISGEEGLKDVRYLSAIYEAAATGKKIML